MIGKPTTWDDTTALELLFSAPSAPTIPVASAPPPAPCPPPAIHRVEFQDYTRCLAAASQADLYGQTLIQRAVRLRALAAELALEMRAQAIATS